MRRWIVTTAGKDRPGIVAGVTKVLYRLGCNLEDSAMARLGGEFAIMLVFATPPTINEAALRGHLGRLERRLRLVAHLKPLTKGEAATAGAPGRRHLLCVYGADRAGIVYRVAEVLAKARVNITDVHTHLTTTKGSPLYLMILEVDLPTRLSAASLQQTLKRVARRLAVEVSLRPSEAAVL
jgi:glycine cleavage system transcriptional repressor